MLVTAKILDYDGERLTLLPTSCGMPADVHHVDRIGMGRDRERIVHEGLRAIALCRRHHHKAHQDQRGLFEQYHIYGIPLDKRLCDRLKLRKEDSA